MRTMLDALDPLNIPLGTPMDLLATYIDHPEIDSHGLGRARFPDSIDVTISAHVHAAHVLDVETGAALPSDVPRWMSLAAHCRTVYCTADTWAMVVDACLDAHVPAPQHWLAHWDDVADVPAGCVAHQFSDGPPGNPYDLSAVVDFWPTVDPAPVPDPPPPNPPETDVFLVNVYEADGKTLLPNYWAMGGPHVEVVPGSADETTLRQNGVTGPAGGHAISWAMHQSLLAQTAAPVTGAAPVYTVNIPALSVTATPQGSAS